MARIFRKPYNKNGKRKESKAWRIEFNDHLRIKRCITAFSDKSASDAAGRKLDKLVALRMAGEGPDADLTSWLETCSQKFIEKLGEWGVLTRERALAGKLLLQHIDDWCEAMLAGGTGEDRVRDSKSRMVKIMTACGFRTWSDIDALRIEKQLSIWQKDGTISAQTRNHYVTSASNPWSEFSASNPWSRTAGTLLK